MYVYWKNLKSVKEKVSTFILWTFAAREVFPLFWFLSQQLVKD